MKRGWGQISAVIAAIVVLVVVVGGLVFFQGRKPVSTGAEPSSFAIASQIPVSLPSRTAYPSGSGIRTPPRPTLTVDTGCRLGKGPAKLATVPPAVADRVNRAWARIETWLAAHAPATVLGKPAVRNDIATLQRDIGAPIPPELTASLLRHNGADQVTGFTFPPFYRPVGVHEIGLEAKTLCEVLASAGDESVGSWWHGQYVPFAVDGSGEALFVDQRAGKHGKLGEHDNEGDVNFDRWPQTLTDLLEQTATALETGGRIGHSRAKVTPEGVLDWEILR